MERFFCSAPKVYTCLAIQLLVNAEESLVKYRLNEDQKEQNQLESGFHPENLEKLKLIWG
jgi:hypothetical protein